ncbi:MAG: hypothetical protein Tsb005_13800 [Gammaproteobacteria bacterium]
MDNVTHLIKHLEFGIKSLITAITQKIEHETSALTLDSALEEVSNIIFEELADYDSAQENEFFNQASDIFYSGAISKLLNQLNLSAFEKIKTECQTQLTNEANHDGDTKRRYQLLLSIATVWFDSCKQLTREFDNYYQNSSNMVNVENRKVQFKQLWKQLITLHTSITDTLPSLITQLKQAPQITTLKLVAMQNKINALKNNNHNNDYFNKTDIQKIATNLITFLRQNRKISGFKWQDVITEYYGTNFNLWNQDGELTTLLSQYFGTKWSSLIYQVFDQAITRKNTTLLTNLFIENINIVITPSDRINLMTRAWTLKEFDLAVKLITDKNDLITLINTSNINFTYNFVWQVIEAIDRLLHAQARIFTHLIPTLTADKDTGIEIIRELFDLPKLRKPLQIEPILPPPPNTTQSLRSIALENLLVACLLRIHCEQRIELASLLPKFLLGEKIPFYPQFIENAFDGNSEAKTFFATIISSDLFQQHLKNCSMQNIPGIVFDSLLMLSLDNESHRMTQEILATIFTKRLTQHLPIVTFKTKTIYTKLVAYMQHALTAFQEPSWLTHICYAFLLENADIDNSSDTSILASRGQFTVCVSTLANAIAHDAQLVSFICQNTDLLSQYSINFLMGALFTGNVQQVETIMTKLTELHQVDPQRYDDPQVLFQQATQYISNLVQNKEFDIAMLVNKLGLSYTTALQTILNSSFESSITLTEILSWQTPELYDCVTLFIQPNLVTLQDPNVETKFLKGFDISQQLKLLLIFGQHAVHTKELTWIDTIKSLLGIKQVKYDIQTLLAVLPTLYQRSPFDILLALSLLPAYVDIVNIKAPKQEINLLDTISELEKRYFNPKARDSDISIWQTNQPVPLSVITNLEIITTPIAIKFWNVLRKIKNNHLSNQELMSCLHLFNQQIIPLENQKKDAVDQLNKYNYANKIDTVSYENKKFLPHNFYYYFINYHKNFTHLMLYLLKNNPSMVQGYLMEVVLFAKVWLLDFQQNLKINSNHPHTNRGIFAVSLLFNIAEHLHNINQLCYVDPQAFNSKKLVIDLLTRQLLKEVFTAFDTDKQPLIYSMKKFTQAGGYTEDHVITYETVTELDKLLLIECVAYYEAMVINPVTALLLDPNDALINIQNTVNSFYPHFTQFYDLIQVLTAVVLGIGSYENFAEKFKQTTGILDTASLKLLRETIDSLVEFSHVLEKELLNSFELVLEHYDKNIISKSALKHDPRFFAHTLQGSDESQQQSHTQTLWQIFLERFKDKILIDTSSQKINAKESTSDKAEKTEEENDDYIIKPNCNP